MTAVLAAAAPWLAVLAGAGGAAAWRRRRHAGRWRRDRRDDPGALRIAWLAAAPRRKRMRGPVPRDGEPLSRDEMRALADIAGAMQRGVTGMAAPGSRRAKRNGREGT